MEPRIKSRFIWCHVRRTFHCFLQYQKFQRHLKLDMTVNRRCVNVYLREEFSCAAEWSVGQCWVNVPWTDFSRNTSGHEGLLVCQLTDPRVIFLPGMGENTKMGSMLRNQRQKNYIKIKKLKLVTQTSVFWCPFAKRLMGKYPKYSNMKP